MNTEFNLAPPTVMLIDINSCFATIEQQANPQLRGRPVVVAAYAKEYGCILAASQEAKPRGIKTGMRVKEAKALCPEVVVLPPDPPKYRFVNRSLLHLLQSYCDNVEVKSIDEMVMNLYHSPRLQLHLTPIEDQMRTIALEIKDRVRKEIGEWITVSIGIAPNRYLAKIASNLHKPDGLEVITHQNIEKVLSGLQLEELCGIKRGYGKRLRMYGLTTPMALYRSSVSALKRAFASKMGYDWWLWLHGWDSGLFDNTQTKSIGHSYALGTPRDPSDPRLYQILCQLVEKMGRRLREEHFTTQGIHISCLFADHTHWSHGEKLPYVLFTSDELYKTAKRMLEKAPNAPVRILAVSCFLLAAEDQEQLNLFGSSDKKKGLTKALDTIANTWGEFTVFPGRMLSMEQKVLDRIAFGGVKGLEEMPFEETIERELYS